MMMMMMTMMIDHDLQHNKNDDDDDDEKERLKQLKAYLLISRLIYLCGSMLRDTDKIGRHDCDICEDR
jgi:hypothetical protein